MLDGIFAWGGSNVDALTDSSSPLMVGGLRRSGGSIGQRFHGKMDNLEISVDRRELFDKSGIPLAEPAVMTAEHLTNQPGFVSMEFVYQDPVTPECHAGTLAQRPNGDIVGAWFGGTHEGHIDVGIWSSVFDGNKWSVAQKIAHGMYADGRQSTTFNPVLFQYPGGGPLLLFYMGGTLDNLLGTLKTSWDGGRTWSRARHLPGVRGASKNKPVLLSDGTLVCPDNGKCLIFDRTRDFGTTWLSAGRTPPSEEIDAIQPTLLLHSDNKLQALARSHTGSIITTSSEDGGQTWFDLEKTSLPNNYSGIDVVTLSNGLHLLVYNHTGIPKGKWGGNRTPLNVAVSKNGIKWPAALVLEDEQGEYSYPAVIQASDGKVHVLYTWNRLRMKHVVLNPEAFKLRPIINGAWPEMRE